jgi:hypothetical protein
MAVPVLACGKDGVCRTVLMPAAPPGDVTITASVGANGKNRYEDVRTIQDALNQVPVTDGGPVPPLKVDGIVGPKTLGAIKKFQKQACGFQWPDGTVEVGRKTHQKLREFFVPSNPYVMPRVYASLSEAMSWIFMAKVVLDSAGLFLSSGFKAGEPGLKLVDKYFHIGSLSASQRSSAIHRVYGVFTDMQMAIGHSSAQTTIGSGYFQEDPKSDESAYTYNGGFTRRRNGRPAMSKDDNYEGPNHRQDTIHMCSRTISSWSQEGLVGLIVHELAHFVGPEITSPDRIDDHSYRNKKDFFKLSAHLALRTADCYAGFAGEAKLRREPSVF